MTPPDRTLSGRKTDPSFEWGALRALGDHKGAGLAFVCEILAGAFTGAGCAGPMPRPFSNNMFAIFMDMDAFAAQDGIAAEIHSYADFFTSSKPEEEGGTVLTPGQPERIKRADRLANGVPMSDGAWESIIETAEKVGMSPEDIERAINA